MKLTFTPFLENLPEKNHKPCLILPRDRRSSSRPAPGGTDLFYVGQGTPAWYDFGSPPPSLLPTETPQLSALVLKIMQLFNSGAFNIAQIQTLCLLSRSRTSGGRMGPLIAIFPTCLFFFLTVNKLKHDLIFRSNFSSG